MITPVYLEIALISGARSGTQTTGQVISAIDTADISIRALREEGDTSLILPRGMSLKFLSTPSARRATMRIRDYNTIRTISIHALREEGDPVALDSGAVPMTFLSTPSVKRATRPHFFS